MWNGMWKGMWKGMWNGMWNGIVVDSITDGSASVIARKSLFASADAHLPQPKIPDYCRIQ